MLLLFSFFCLQNGDYGICVIELVAFVVDKVNNLVNNNVKLYFFN